MPNRSASDHIGNFNFKVEIEGVTVGAFHSLESSTRGVVSKIEPTLGAEGIGPGMHAWGEITLKKGYVSSDDHWSWRQQVTSRRGTRKDVTIACYDRSGREQLKLNLAGALPSRMTFMGGTGNADDQPMEELSLNFDSVSVKR